MPVEGPAFEKRGVWAPETNRTKALFRSEQNRAVVLSLFMRSMEPYIPNMEFDNETTPDKTFGAQVRSHLPIVLVGGGLAVAFVGMHTAASSIAVLAVLHAAVGVGVFAFRRHRLAAGATTGTGTGVVDQ